MVLGCRVRPCAFENVGIVFPAQAAEIGLVGPAARLRPVRDVRYDHPAGWHRSLSPVAVWPGGDVFARARVRSLEIQRSGEYLHQQLAAPADGNSQRTSGARAQHARRSAGGRLAR